MKKILHSIVLSVFLSLFLSVGLFAAESDKCTRSEPVARLLGQMSRNSTLKWYIQRKRYLIDTWDDMNKSGMFNIQKDPYALMLMSEVPLVNNNFPKWFNNLSLSQFEKLWKNTTIREKVESELRLGAERLGGNHEWCLICKTPIFKKWGLTYEKITGYVTKTTELTWTIPSDAKIPEAGLYGYHGGPGSPLLHQKLADFADQADALGLTGRRSFNHFKRSVATLLIDWKVKVNGKQVTVNDLFKLD